MTATSGHEHYWRTARTVCTEKQLRILELRELHGFSLRSIAFTTQLSVSTVRDHLDAAHRRVDLALKESRP